jgi:RNA polymerase sigma-70 factor (ECF subfamily)
MLPLPVRQPSEDLSAPPSDLRAAQAGDGLAFERLYRAHVGRVHALALRLTGDPARAEELVQDAFVRAWKKLPSFRGESSFATWMHRLTVNVFLLDARSVRRRMLREIPDDGVADSAGTRRAVHLDQEDRIDLEQAIARLPDGARVAFVLYDVYGYSHDEIAAMSGVAAGTIRAQLHRARRRLLEALNR